jgi:hypothetical protein
MAQAVYRSAACGEVQPIDTHVPSVSVASGV